MLHHESKMAAEGTVQAPLVEAQPVASTEAGADADADADEPHHRGHPRASHDQGQR